MSGSGMGKGRFISFEGLDGSGKSTQIRLLQDFLAREGHETVVAREPGGTVVGEGLRTLALDKANGDMAPMTEVMLYAAARAQLLSQVIRPNLEAGRTVLCDRFTDSSMAYQGYGRGLLEAVEAVNAWATEGCQPDLTFLLKAPPETGAARREGRDEDRMESQAASYHQRVWLGYLELERRNPDRIVGVDGTLEAGEISEIIKGRVARFLKGEE